MQVARPLRHRRAAYAAAARDLHLWLLQVVAWLMARVRLPRAWRLEFQADIRTARRDIRRLIFMSMCSRLTFRVDRSSFTRRPNGVLGFQRRHARIVHAFTRGIPLRTPQQMRDALKNFDKTVKRALARLPKNGAVSGAVVTVLAVMIAVSTSALTPAAEAADTSLLLMPDRAAPAAHTHVQITRDSSESRGASACILGPARSGMKTGFFYPASFAAI